MGCQVHYGLLELLRITFGIAEGDYYWSGDFYNVTIFVLLTGLITMQLDGSAKINTFSFAEVILP